MLRDCGISRVSLLLFVFVQLWTLISQRAMTRHLYRSSSCTSSCSWSATLLALVLGADNSVTSSPNFRGMVYTSSIPFASVLVSTEDSVPVNLVDGRSDIECLSYRLVCLGQFLDIVESIPL